MLTTSFTRDSAATAFTSLTVGQHVTLPRPTVKDLAWLRSRLNADRRASGRRYITNTDADTVTVTRIAASSTPDDVRARRPLTIREHLLQMHPGETRFLPSVRTASVANAIVDLRSADPALKFSASPLRDRSTSGVRITRAKQGPTKSAATPPHRWRGLVAIIGADAIDAVATSTDLLPSRVRVAVHPKDADSAVVAIRAPNRATVIYWQAHVATLARAQGGATQTDTVRSVLHASS